MNKTMKTNLITGSIVATLAAFGAVVHWKPAYGLIIGLSVGFVYAVDVIRKSIAKKLDE